MQYHILLGLAKAERLLKLTSLHLYLKEDKHKSPFLICTMTIGLLLDIFLDEKKQWHYISCCLVSMCVPACIWDPIHGSWVTSPCGRSGHLPLPPLTLGRLVSCVWDS